MKLLKHLIIALSAILSLWGCSDDESTTNEMPTISLSTTIIQMNREGGKAVVTVNSSNYWRLTGASDWAHPSAVEGKNGDVVTFTIDPNNLNDIRTATFKFFTGSAVVPLQIESQPGYALELLSKNSYSISQKENTVSLLLNTNIADLAIAYSDEGESWLTFDKRTDFAGKTSLVFKATENLTYKDRNSTITISSPLATQPINVQVSQKQSDAIITENSTFIYDLSAQVISLTVKSNVDYKIDVTQGNEWITDEIMSEPQQEENGLSTVVISYKLTAANTSRGGAIRISKNGGNLVKNIAIIQKDPNKKLVDIPDATLRKLCIDNEWILSVAGTKCIILKKGLDALRLHNDSFNDYISDLTGIENFPNLTEISLGYCPTLKKIDISALHNVKSFSLDGPTNCSEYNFGDNPILQFILKDQDYVSHPLNIKIISSKLESLNLSIISWYQYYDAVESIDLSECPALKSANVDRGPNMKTLYLKTGQEIPDLIKNEATVIAYK